MKVSVHSHTREKNLLQLIFEDNSVLRYYAVDGRIDEDNGGTWKHEDIPIAHYGPSWLLEDSQWYREDLIGHLGEKILEFDLPDTLRSEVASRYLVVVTQFALLSSASRRQESGDNKEMEFLRSARRQAEQSKIDFYATIREINEYLERSRNSTMPQQL